MTHKIWNMKDQLLLSVSTWIRLNECPKTSTSTRNVVGVLYLKKCQGSINFSFGVRLQQLQCWTCPPSDTLEELSHDPRVSRSQLRCFCQLWSAEGVGFQVCILVRPAWRTWILTRLLKGFYLRLETINLEFSIVGCCIVCWKAVVSPSLSPEEMKYVYFTC